MLMEPLPHVEYGRQLQAQKLGSGQKRGFKGMLPTASRRCRSAVGGPSESAELGFKSTTPAH